MQLRIITKMMDLRQCPKCKRITTTLHGDGKVSGTYNCYDCDVELDLIETVVTDVDIESGMI